MSAHILFDLDGTLIDSEYSIARITIEVAALENCKVTMRKAFHTYGGWSFKNRFNAIARDNNLVFSEEKKVELHKIYQKCKEEMYANSDIPMIRGARNLIERLAKHPANFTLGLASSNECDRTRRVITNVGLAHHFGDRIFGSDLVGGLKKPHPAIYRKAIEGLDPKKVAVVEDSQAGVLSAKQNGAFVVAHVDVRGGICKKRNEEFRDNGADLIIHDYSNFEEIMQRSWKYWPNGAVPKVA